MSLSIWTLAAPRPSVKFTPVNAIAGPVARSIPEVSFMRLFRRPCDLRFLALQPRSYGLCLATVQARTRSGALSKPAAGFPLKMRALALPWSLSWPLFWALVAACVFGGLVGAARAANEPVQIVALGDSLTAGYNLPARAAFP